MNNNDDELIGLLAIFSTLSFFIKSNWSRLNNIISHFQYFDTMTAKANPTNETKRNLQTYTAKLQQTTYQRHSRSSATAT